MKLSSFFDIIKLGDNMKTIEVVAAVLKKDDLFFCAQRKNEGPLAKKWEFPGGKLEVDETPENALKRELNEELNIDVEVGEFITTVRHQYPTFFIIMHSYFCDIDTFNIKLNEHLDSKWLSMDELDSLDWADADKPIVEKIKLLSKRR